MKNERYKIRKQEEKIKSKDLKNEAKKYIYDFQPNETIRSFVESIHTGKINTKGVETDQSNLSKNLVKFNEKSKSKTAEGKSKKPDTFESAYALYEALELIPNAFRSRIFLIKETQRKGLKILTPKQMLQRLPIGLAQVKAGNTSENLLNEI